MNTKFTVRVITYSAICITLAIILSNIKLFSMPQGGTVTACSAFFITIIGYWFGAYVGVAAGVAYGFLQLAFGAYIVHPAQLILDYPLAFGMLGLSGIFRNQKWGLYIGYVVGSIGRFICSVLSGIIFFAEYAPEGKFVLIYSLEYNASYILPEMIITILIISVPAFKNAIQKINSQVTA